MTGVPITESIVSKTRPYSGSLWPTPSQTSAASGWDSASRSMTAPPHWEVTSRYGPLRTTVEIVMPMSTMWGTSQ